MEHRTRALPVVAVLLLALAGCTSTSLVTPAGHPARPEAAAPALPAPGAVLRPDYRPPVLAGEEDPEEPAPPHHGHHHHQGGS